MQRLYTALFYLALPFILARLLWRSRKNRGYRQGWGERLGYYGSHPILQGSIWVHAVSVGETIAIAPFIRALKKQFPDKPIVVTSTTPTGKERVQALLGELVSSVYAPYDLPHILHRFFRRMNPCLCLLVETELWPNLIFSSAKRSIPVVVVNGRLSERSMRRYLKYPRIVRAMMQNISCIMAQFPEDAERFKRLGIAADRVQAMGSLKFDVTVSDSVVETGLALRREIGKDRPVWLAASTHSGEEELLLQAHRCVLEKIPNVLLILVPRHPERFNAVNELIARDNTVVRRSEAIPILPTTEVYLGDTMGELMVLFSACDAVFMGGSLVEVGGHNFLEPALLKKPLLSGPHVHNFAVIAQWLVQNQALFFISSAKECAAILVNWLQDTALAAATGMRAFDVVNRHRGSLSRQLACVASFVQMDVEK